MKTHKAESSLLDSFCLWQNYWGLLAADRSHPELPTDLYAFDTRSAVKNGTSKVCILPATGTSYGFVGSGRVHVADEKVSWNITAGQWFSLPQGARCIVEPQSSFVAMLRVGYHGVYAMGGPVESQGRLRYIDGCSDSLLLAPQMIGDPCINLLHFPPNTRQTMHTHPSSRMGIVISGFGECETESTLQPLRPGDVFFIPKDVMHNFRTPECSTLNVFAYHPDSDWGPKHDDHPMINRTWVNGQKIEQL